MSVPLSTLSVPWLETRNRIGDILTTPGIPLKTFFEGPYPPLVIPHARLTRVRVRARAWQTTPPSLSFRTIVTGVPRQRKQRKESHKQATRDCSHRLGLSGHCALPIRRRTEPHLSRAFRDHNLRDPVVWEHQFVIRLASLLCIMYDTSFAVRS
ncbi:hypothetical protein CDEST_08934 [Colletotrichum destructivum]|uniref:Uncharacterized protein n=1 Tax=Colletotrichum destructivum TaxID=34406 RepID=A0AAX4IKE5_9PEZI|nr:hypothetical protein CDEST_08934 [Colletotrichum destructivum]